MAAKPKKDKEQSEQQPKVNPPVVWEVEYADAMLGSVCEYLRHQWYPMHTSGALPWQQWSGTFEKTDKWMLVSGLQKSIRRSHPISAMLYVHALMHTDAAYGRYRLGICAIEETAGADVPLALSVLQTRMNAKVLAHIEQQASARLDAQKEAHLIEILKGSKGQVVLSMFAQLMAVGLKERTACNLMSVVHYALGQPPKTFTRQHQDILSGHGSVSDLYQLAIDSNADVRARYGALGQLFGAFSTPMLAEEKMKHKARGAFDSACALLSARHVHAKGNEQKVAHLRQLVDAASGFGQENFGMSLALVHEKEPIDFTDTIGYWRAQSEHFAVAPWQTLWGTGATSVSNGSKVQVHQNMVLASLDKHTAEGKRLIEQWLRGSKALGQMLAKVPKAQQIEALGSALFWVEGHVCTPVQPRALYDSSIAASRWLCAKQIGVTWGQVEQVLLEQLPQLHVLRRTYIDQRLGPAPSAAPAPTCYNDASAPTGAKSSHYSGKCN